MNKRLASFAGPSTPSASPVQVRQQPSSPQSPSRTTESTYHRKVRALLQDIRTITRIWDDLVKHDGLKAATLLTDTRTDLDNTLRMLSGDAQPCSHLVTPRLAIMEKCIGDLDTVILKLKRQFLKLSAVMDSLESLVSEAHKAKGWAWVETEPLWCTWTLERFATKMPDLLPPYHRSLQLQTELVDSLRSHSVTFEESRVILTKWVSQPFREAHDWVQEWEDLCAIEVDKWHRK
ncbi:hypothetical protein ACEPAH_4947 [Sanghuangporus vaninii]